MKAVDLFSGAGGWSTGATQAGVRVACAVNHWPRAVETHQRNHPETEHRCQDIALMDPRDLPAHDILLASPACQGHSRARGTDKPHHDSSRATAWSVIDTAEVTRPRLIAVENVPEFREWALYPLWRAALERLGYRLAENVLDASDFGAPQERERLFITGTLSKTANPAIRSPRLPKVPAASFIDFSTGRWSPVEKPGRAAKTLERIRAGRATHGERFLVAFYGATRGGRSLERPIGTITTVDRYLVVDGDRCRMLTIDEAKAAMAFPADYVLTGTGREQMKQLGNAVSPVVAREVVRQLMEAA